MAIAPDEQHVRTRLRQALLTRGLRPSPERSAAFACASGKRRSSHPERDPRVWLALAKLADSPAEAVDALRELLRFVPNHPGGRRALRNALAADARALAEAELAEPACERWREAMTLAGGDVETWLGVAATTSNPEEAARAVETAYKLNPRDERAIAAMERLRCSRVDPSQIEAPVDAFARFDAIADGFASIKPADDLVEQLDSRLDAFAEHFAPAAEPEVAVAVKRRRPRPWKVSAPAPVPHGSCGCRTKPAESAPVVGTVPEAGSCRRAEARAGHDDDAGRGAGRFLPPPSRFRRQAWRQVRDSGRDTAGGQHCSGGRTSRTRRRACC